MQPPWLGILKKLVEQKPLIIIRFDRDEWEGLYNSRRGVHEFTIARSHSLFDDVKTPAPCLIVGTELAEFFPKSAQQRSHLHFGLLGSQSGVTTLESRIKVRRCLQIRPNSEIGLLQLVSAKPHRKNLADRLGSKQSIIRLSPKLASHVIERLASMEENHGAMRAVAESLSSPKQFRNAVALQEDAVRMRSKLLA
jgi:hypothetical protein